MNHFFRTTGAALGALAITTTGLGVGLAGAAQAATAIHGAHPTSPSATPAATLSAALDEVMREHVDLTANVLETAVTTGASSAQTMGALAALATNTNALGTAFGSLYGPAAKQEF